MSKASLQSRGSRVDLDLPLHDVLRLKQSIRTSPSLLSVVDQEKWSFFRLPALCAVVMVHVPAARQSRTKDETEQTASV